MQKKRKFGPPPLYISNPLHNTYFLLEKEKQKTDNENYEKENAEKSQFLITV